MSDTVKLIIEIHKVPKNDHERWVLSHGIPLDDVKAEMQKVRRFHVGNFEDDNPIDYGIVEGFDKALKIIDNIGKAESEDKE